MAKTLVIEDNWYSNKLIETKEEKTLLFTTKVYKFLHKDFFRVQLPNKTIDYSYREYTYKLYNDSEPKKAKSEDMREISYIMDKRNQTVLLDIINTYEKQGYYVSPKYISMFMAGKIKRLIMQSRK